jgi:hypothetical protein
MVNQRVLAARARARVRLDFLQERQRVPPPAVSVVCPTQTKHSLVASNYEFWNPSV